MNVRILEPGESLPKGATPIRLLPVELSFCPRGSLQKNSLGEYLIERFNGAHNAATDSKYADSYDDPEADEILADALVKEVFHALDYLVGEDLRRETVEKITEDY